MHRLSLSTGTSGNSEIPNYDHLALVAGGPTYKDTAGIDPAQNGNEKLGWETHLDHQPGLRLGFFDRAECRSGTLPQDTPADMLMERTRILCRNRYNGYRWDNVGVMTKPWCGTHCRRRHHPYQRFRMECQCQRIVQQERDQGTL